MDMEHEIPKKIGLLASHGDGEPPKTLDACYVRHRISQKGKLLLDQIHRLQCYAWNLCEIYDVTCCYENPKKHLVTPSMRL